MNSSDRKTVLQIGSLGLNLRPFDERGLHLVKCTLDEARKGFNSACGIVVAEGPGKMGFVRSCFESLAKITEDCGLTFISVVTLRQQRHVVKALWKELEVRSQENIYLIEDLAYAAQHILEWDPGPPLGNPKIETTGFAVDDRTRIVIQRAFGDCEKVFLEELKGGRGSLGVYCVHAWLKRSRVGPRPLPFFVKIADKRAVDAELVKYSHYAELYIPFHLRPNVVQSRCVTLCDRAAIVGNFVDDTLSLRKALRSGNTGALFSLFERTLKGFRLQPFVAGEEPQVGQLPTFLKNRMRIKELEGEKMDVIKRAIELGLKTDPAVLERTIVEAAEKLLCRIGPYHGDMHCGNVMVRGGDTIVIDFSSAGDGPLTADPAALEVSLMFGTDDDDKQNSFDEWKAFIDEIFLPGTALRPPALPESRPNQFSWLRRALRELRHILSCCDCDVVEAKIVVAAYLIRFARLSIEDLRNAELRKLAFDRHAYALVIADRIVSDLSTKVRS